MFSLNDSVKVIHNHVGFRPEDTMKKVVVPYTPEARQIFSSPVFQVINQNELSKLALNDPKQQENVFTASMEYVKDDFGEWLENITDTTLPSFYGQYALYNK